MKQIEKIVIRKRTAMTRRGKAVFALAIREQYAAALKAIETHGIGIERIQDAIRPEPIEHAFNLMYVQAADIAVAWRNELMPKKDATDDMLESMFGRAMLEFVRTKAGQRITNITGTTKEHIVAVVQEATTEATVSGLGIVATRNLIIENIAKDYKQFTRARAQMIAQTEMITASNTATREAALSTGLETRKFWSTSGLGNVRDSHLLAEDDSINRGGLRDEETFSNGLLYPGDPSGDWPEEVCNCHCSLLEEIV